MKPTRRSFIAGASATLAAPLPASAADVDKPVRLVVPVVGGTMDLLARILAPGLSQALGRPVIVDNKPGAGGAIAVEQVANAQPDGDTLLVSANGPLTISVSLPDAPVIDPLKALIPITMAVRLNQVLVVNPALQVSTIQEFFSYVRAHPGKLNYASIAPGSVSHLTMERLKLLKGLDMVHVPYKGAAPALADLLANVVQAGFFVTANVIEYVKSKRLIAVASASLERPPAFPDVPTLIEVGVKDFDASGWIGILATAGTPSAIVERYQREITRLLNDREIRDKLVALDFEIVGSTSAQFGAALRQETEGWKQVIRQLGAQLK